MGSFLPSVGAFESFIQHQRQWHGLFEVPLDLLCSLNRDSCFQEVSSSWADTLGWHPEELVGHSWREWLHPLDVQLSLLQLHTLLNKRSAQSRLKFEARLRHRDGSYRWFAWELVRTPEAWETIYGFARDITVYKMDVMGSQDELPVMEPDFSVEFSRVAESLRDVFWIYDPLANKQLYISPSYERVWGRSRQSLYENPGSFHTAIHPEDHDYVQTRLAEGQDSSSIEMEYRIVRPTGEVRWIHDRSFPIRDKWGRVYHFVGIAEDITQRRDAEQACDRLFEQLSSQNQTLENQVSLRTSELRAIIDAIPDQIYVVRRDDLRIDYCNSAFAQGVQHHDSHSLEGASLNDCFEPAIAARTLREIRHVFQTGESIQSEETRWINGTAYTFDTTKVPLSKADGEIYALVSASRDISAFKESEERFRAIFEQAAVGISLVQPEGRFIAVNQRFCELMGYNETELLDMTFQQITDPHHLQADLEQYQRLLRGEIPSFALEKCFIRKDKQLQWVTLTVSGVYGDDGQMKYDIGVLQDINARKKAEDDVLTALEKERELNELKSRVISMISHEYRTPLTIICTSAELLQRYSANWSDERRNTHFERIQSAVQHLTDLVNDVLFLNRAEANRMEFNPVYVDVYSFFQEISDAFQVGLQDGHSLEVLYPPGRPQVWIDERLLRQIVNNLLSNALKYSPQGGLIRCRLECPENRLCFSIQDYGIGIPEEELAFLFDSFHRAANVGTIPGTGLGLAIVKKCVDVHQGQISVESHIGQGTCFTVTLPSIRP